jgi:hypothetical protein
MGGFEIVNRGFLGFVRIVNICLADL